jgi:hypothetical protein
MLVAKPAPIRFLLFVTTFFFFSTSAVQAEDVARPAINSKLFYLHEGKTVNWSTQVQNSQGQSASGKVTVTPSDRNGKGDAIKVIWDAKKSGQGNFAIYGSPLDISNLENDAALYIEMKVIVPPKSNTTIGMDCGYPCGGKVPVGKNLKQLKRGEWDVLPIPLNCLTKEGLDLKKVNGAIVIGTDGKMEIELGDIRLLKLAEGDKGCQTPDK